MKISVAVLERVRGPILAVTMAGCAGASATAEVVPDQSPQAPEAAALSAPDPVRYDARLESGRLARLDRARFEAEARRERRLEDEAAGRIAALRARQAQLSAQQAQAHSGQYYEVISCGRG